MRCTWCSAEATQYEGAAFIPPCCDAEPCLAASADVNHALWDWREAAWGMSAQIAPNADVALVAAATDAVEDRDYREQRGERIDWTRPVEGWALW